MDNAGSDSRILFNRDAQFSLSRAEGKPITLAGYALAWNVLSDDRGGYKVRLRPGSARFAPVVHALYHHDHRKVLGTTTNNSLRYKSDDVGVRVEIDLPNTNLGRDVAELVGSGYLTGMSFAMARPPKGSRSTEAGQVIVNVEEFTSDEVSLTPIPAFPSASIGVKGTGENLFAAFTTPTTDFRRDHALLRARLQLDFFRPPGGVTPRRNVNP